LRGRFTVTHDQVIIIVIGVATILMFLWGRWRHDMVAAASLLACVLAGLVPSSEAFAGFGHPAVITVACVLILSQGLKMTGAVDALVQGVVPTKVGPTLTIATLAGLGAALSAFMNNVGALALLMPVAIQVAGKHNLPPGQVLMPLSFGTILGGMTTLIGTPPNLIVSSFRAGTDAGTFAMFDFSPVGLAVAGGGILFLALFGSRLVPSREQTGSTGFETGTYLTEVLVTEEGKSAGKTLHDLEPTLDEVGAQVVGMVRNEFRIFAPNPKRVLRSGDILVIEAEPESLASALSSLGLNLVEAVPLKPDKEDPPQEAAPAAKVEVSAKSDPESAEIELQELVLMPGSSLIGRSARDVRLRSRYSLNLLALSRQGRRSIKRLRSTALLAGDLLLMQGTPEALNGFVSDYGCVPLAKRAIRIPDKRQAVTATLIMAAAVGGAAFGLLPAAISFAAGVLAVMALRIIPPRMVYEAVDWPVIVLLGALIPVAGAMATTGTADLMARLLVQGVAQGQAVIGLTVILIVTMTLSDFMNNAATAAVMCPIAISTSTQLGASADPFLMAVAVGASCAFLTPIGHQNNTLILGPGGFRFGDYWRLGLPLELLVVAIGVPMLLLVWPL
jgi:di/tricarboxylate transporter